jgi:hypothetical protein
MQRPRQSGLLNSEVFAATALHNAGLAICKFRLDRLANPLAHEKIPGSSNPANENRAVEPTC